MRKIKIAVVGTGNICRSAHMPVYMKRDDVEVLISLLPARAKDKNGYIEEFENIGFDVEKIIEMDMSTAIPHSASIYVRKVIR